MSRDPDEQMTRGKCFTAFLPSMLAIAAIILGTAGNFYCQTIKFVQESGEGLTLYASPWNYRTQDSYEWQNQTWVYTTCRSYMYIEDQYGYGYSVDAKTRTVWAFSIMTPIIGGLLLVGACLGPCMTVRPTRWKTLGVLFIFMSLFQGLTLMVTSSSICTSENPILQYLEFNDPNIAETFPESCEKATGYILSIIAVILWFFAGACALAFPAPVVVAEHPATEQTVTYRQKADGTVEETNVKIVKGTAVPLEETAETK